jgi:hypothetical protein
MLQKTVISILLQNSPLTNFLKNKQRFYSTIFLMLLCSHLNVKACNVIFVCLYCRSPKTMIMVMTNCYIGFLLPHSYQKWDFHLVPFLWEIFVSTMTTHLKHTPRAGKIPNNLILEPSNGCAGRKISYFLF